MSVFGGFLTFLDHISRSKAISSAYAPGFAEPSLGLFFKYLHEVVAIPQLQIRIHAFGQLNQECHEKPFVQIFAHLVKHEPIAKWAFLNEYLQLGQIRVVFEVLPVSPMQ